MNDDLDRAGASRASRTASGRAPQRRGRERAGTCSPATCRCRSRSSSAKRSSTTSRGCRSRRAAGASTSRRTARRRCRRSCFARQLDAGAWGLTFATVTQLAVGVAAGARRTRDRQPGAVRRRPGRHPGAAARAPGPAHRVPGRLAGAARADRGMVRRAMPASVPFEVMLEIGLAGGRTGCRTHDEARGAGRRLHASAAVRLVGIECYEGQGANGDTAHDAPYASALMDRVEAIAAAVRRRKALRHRRGAALGRRLGDLRSRRHAG